MHESSMRANSSRRRSLLVDVELELVDVEIVSCFCICSTIGRSS